MKPYLLLFIILITGCTPEATTVVSGNRHLESTTIGKLNSDGDGSRLFYVLHDKDTGADYLAVIDAGIIRLEPLQPQPLEKP